MNTINSLDELEHRLNPLSVKEAASIYGDSASNFYKMIRRGEVPGVFRKEGQRKARIKICPKEFVAWLREQIASSCGATKAKAQPRSSGSGRSSDGRDEPPRPAATSNSRQTGKEGAIAQEGS